MSVDHLIKVAPWEGKYRPLYKLDTTERDWRMLKRDGRAMECASAGHALAAARAHVEEILNPTRLLEDAPVHKLERERDGWKAGQGEKQAAEKRRVFGDTRPATVFAKGGKQVAVSYAKGGRR